MHIHSEIQYTDQRDGLNVHSDLCVEGTPAELQWWHKVLHDSLDEWLRRSGGTGIFYVGDVSLVQFDEED